LIDHFVDYDTALTDRLIDFTATYYSAVIFILF